MPKFCVTICHDEFEIEAENTEEAFEIALSQVDVKVEEMKDDDEDKH